MKHAEAGAASLRTTMSATPSRTDDLLRERYRIMASRRSVLHFILRVDRRAERRLIKDQLSSRTVFPTDKYALLEMEFGRYLGGS